MNRVVLVAALISSFLWIDPCLAGDPHDRVIVVLQHSDTGVSVTIDGQLVEKRLLSELSDAQAASPKAEAVLLVHENVSLRQIDNMLGLINKAGFSKPRVFYFGDDKNRRVELIYGPATYGDQQ